MDITKLTNKELREEIDVRVKRIMSVMEKLVAAGRGAEMCEDIIKLNDELSLEYKAADEALDDIFVESRKRHSKQKPEDEDYENGY